MAENSIQEWLAEYKNLGPAEIHSFASGISHSHELIHAIFNVIEDKSSQHELLEPVCIQLFNFYRSPEVELQYFVIQYVPALIGVYLATLGQPDVKTHRIIEVLILGIYNLDVVNAHGKPRTHSFQLPSLGQPSIYHELLSTITTTDHILRGMDRAELHVITLGPFPQVETLNGQNRLWVMTILMNIYNSNLSYIPKASLRFMCKICSRLVKQGFARQGHLQRSSYGSESLFNNLSYQRTNHRVPLSSALLLEYLHAIYFAMYNGFYQAAVQALEDVHTRATYELYIEVLLVTNAIRNSLKLGPTGQALEGPMGINVALSPSTPTPTLSKAIITNASFRTKKLPDDIPIQSQENEKPLTTISEEQEEPPAEKNEKPRQLKVKVSVGNLIAKAKGKGKDDPSPNSSISTSKSRERIDVKKKLDTSDSGTSIKNNSGKVQSIDTVDYGRIVDAAKMLEAREARIPEGKLSDSNGIEEFEMVKKNGGKRSDDQRLNNGKITSIAESSSVDKVPGSSQFRNGIESDLSGMMDIVRPTDIKLYDTSRSNGRVEGQLPDRTKDVRDGKVADEEMDVLDDLARLAEISTRWSIDGQTADRVRENRRMDDRTDDSRFGNVGRLSGPSAVAEVHRWVDERVPSVMAVDDKRTGKRKSIDSASGVVPSTSGKIGNIPRLVETRRSESRVLDGSRAADYKTSDRKSDSLLGKGLGKKNGRKLDSLVSPTSPSSGDGLFFSDLSQRNKLAETTNGFVDDDDDDDDSVPISGVSNGPDATRKPEFYKAAAQTKKTAARIPDTSDPSDTFTDSGLADISSHTAGTLADVSSPDETVAFGEKETPVGKVVKFGQMTDGKLTIMEQKSDTLSAEDGKGVKGDRYDTMSIEMRSVSSTASKPDFTDSSEETEPSYSLDISNSCSNLTDSEEDIPLRTKIMERKGIRESIHTFV